MESMVTVTGQCFTISLLNSLPHLHIKHLPIRYIYIHCVSEDFKKAHLWGTFFIEYNQEIYRPV